MTFAFERLVLREIHLPLREPFRISSGTTSLRRILLLELIERGGARTFSECVAGDFPNYSPETIDTAWLALREWLLPRVVGRAFERPDEVARELGRDVRGHEMARATVEMGCWGLLAELEGLSLSRLLGGTRPRIATGISIGIQADPPTLVAKAKRALEEGYQKVKIKIQPGADLAYLRAVRAALGPAAPLMADANNAYTLADVEHLAQVDELGLIMIEQPLAWNDVLQHAVLQRRLRTPICLDESIISVERAREMIDHQAGRIVNIKPGRVGGFGPSRAIHDLCRDHGIPVWCGGMLESGVGRAYNVALASLENFTLPGDLSPSRRYWERDVVFPEWTMDEHGWVAVPERPGLGVEVDGERIESLTVRRDEVRSGVTAVAGGR